MIDPIDIQLEYDSDRKEGGQHVGVSEGFITLTHVPTGQSVKTHTGVFRSQFKARQIAVTLLELMIEEAKL